MMNTTWLNKNFERIGARLKVLGDASTRRFNSSSIRLDIERDRQGEFFSLFMPTDNPPEVEVLNVQPSDRHLLLMARQDNEKNKFLCGHDERHWFVAGIPESASVGTVQQAKDALQPAEVRLALGNQKVSGKSRYRRKNDAYRRQGEWFFVPEPNLIVDENNILENEPIRRGSGKAHWLDYCYRSGGELVYVCRRHPNGVTESRYKTMLSKNPKAAQWNWTAMRRNMGVYARGRVRHPDHATINLHNWCRVLMNTENESRAMRHVAFLD